MKLRQLVLAVAVATLCGCGGLLESTMPVPQAYVLRLPADAVPPAGISPTGSIKLQSVEAGPGLNSDRIALLRSDRRFDVYAASLWAAPAPDLVEGVIIDALRATGAFRVVFDDSAPFAPRYGLRVTLRRFEADYTSGGRAPTVHVVLDCTLGRHRDRELLATFTARGTAPAAEDRLNAVVAAFELATAAAMRELGGAVTAALAAEKPPASESR